VDKRIEEGLSMFLEGLADAVADKIADKIAKKMLAEIPSAPTASAAKPPKEKKAEKPPETPAAEEKPDLRKQCTAAVVALVKAKGRETAVTLLAEFGAKNVPELKEEKLAEFLLNAKTLTNTKAAV
jgi:hypothetical protein